VYRQFASKEELYEAVVARLDGIRARLTASSASVDPTERIRMLAVAYAAHFLESPQFFPMWATGKLNRDWGLKSRVSTCARQGVRPDDFPRPARTCGMSPSLHHIILSLEAQLAGLASAVLAAGGAQVLVMHHHGANEALLQIGVEPGDLSAPRPDRRSQTAKAAKM